jgi:hypothetical protein
MTTLRPLTDAEVSCVLSDVADRFRLPGLGFRVCDRLAEALQFQIHHPKYREWCRCEVRRNLDGLARDLLMLRLRETDVIFAS